MQDASEGGSIECTWLAGHHTRGGDGRRREQRVGERRAIRWPVWGCSGARALATFGLSRGGGGPPSGHPVGRCAATLVCCCGGGGSVGGRRSRELPWCCSGARAMATFEAVVGRLLGIL